MSDLSEFFFGATPAIVHMQLLEISHPDFTQTYRVMRNRGGTVDVTHEGPDGPYTYTHFPLKINVVGSGNGLEQSIEVIFGDLGQVLPREISAVRTANTMHTKPILKYREYRSDDLTSPILPAQVFEVVGIAFNRTGATLTARPPAFNRTRTGETYEIYKFPMLRGFI